MTPALTNSPGQQDPAASAALLMVASGEPGRGQRGPHIMHASPLNMYFSLPAHQGQRKQDTYNGGAWTLPSAGRIRKLNGLRQ